MSAKRFAGRRVLVTGASRGIGAAAARRFAAEGADVAIVARTLDQHDHLAGSLRETAAHIVATGARCAMISADLADEDDRARIAPSAVDELGGPIDVLVNNAAAAMYALVVDFTLKRRRLTFEVNVHAPLDLAQAVLPSMLERGEGWIINVSSGTARPIANSSMAVYGASKAALNRMTQGLAVELAGSGIRVNTVEPRAAVMSEGATALIGDTVRADQIESMEEMVEAIVALAECPADFTAQTCVSLDLIDQMGLTVHALDGTPLSPVASRGARMANPFSYEGKRVVVTGAATGVGAALLEVLAELGVEHVTVLDVKPPSGAHDRYLEVNLADEAAVDAAAADLSGPLHALFNNAGVADTSPPRTVIAVNYLALRRLSESLLDWIPEGGAIVNTASTAGGQWATHIDAINQLLDSDWNQVLDWTDANLGSLGVQPYFFSKELVQVNTMRSSRPTIRRGVRTNAVCPSPIDTPLLKDLRETMTDKIIDWNISETNGRLVTAREVATVLAFLGSDAAAYVNGVNLPVDAGFTAAMTTGQVDFAALA